MSIKPSSVIKCYNVSSHTMWNLKNGFKNNDNLFAVNLKTLLFGDYFYFPVNKVR